jgi:hypothetical protein
MSRTALTGVIMIALLVVGPAVERLDVAKGLEVGIGPARPSS